MTQEPKKLPISTIITRFAASLPRRNNYNSVIRKYLLYLLEHDLLIGEPSAQAYFEYYAQTRKLSSSITSPVRRFLTFARQEDFSGVQPDSLEPKVPARFLPLYQGYMDSDISPSSSKSQAPYASTLVQFFSWLDQNDHTLNYEAIVDYIAHMKQSGRPFSYNRYVVTVIKQVVRYVAFHPEPESLGVSKESLASLFKVQYLSASD